MPQSAVLLCPSTTTLEDFARASEAAHLGPVVVEGDVVQVGAPNEGTVRISKLDDEEERANEYEQNEDLPTDFRAVVWDRRYFWFQFNDFSLARAIIRSFLESVTDASTYWLDTDFGWTIRGDAVLRELEQDSQWDWRHDAPG